MNCPKCGSTVVQGTFFCPVCNEPLPIHPYAPGTVAPQPTPQGPPSPNQPGMAAGYPPAYGQQQGYPPQAPQAPVYQQSYAQYQPGAYPPGYQQPYAYGQQPAPHRGALLESLSDLPRAFLNSFTCPGEVLRGLMERRDHVSCAIVAGLALVLSFLGGMVILRSFLAYLLGTASSLSGVSLARDAASLNQGINYLAGRIAPAAGSLSALCQLLGMLIPAGAFMTCLCVVYRVPFTLDLLLGFLTVTTLPTVAVALLSMLAGLLSPWLAALVVLCGMVVSYTQACGMLSYVTGRPEQQLTAAKMICVAVSLVLTLALDVLLGNLMLSNAIRGVLMQLNSLGALI